MGECLLELDNICKSFFGVRAVNDISFSVEKGHVLGLIGENGAGKSTLMNIVGGVIQPDHGKLKFEGKEFICRNPKDATDAGIAFIHQELNLFNNLSIAENIYINSFPKSKIGLLISKKELRKRTRELLAMLDLNISPDTLVEKLTPGEKQLVEIAKALSYDAKLIIFDEPTTSLTERETKRLFKTIEGLKKEGKSIIYISHILEDVLKLADDIVVLRDGEMVDFGMVDEFTIDKMISKMVGRKIDQMYPERTTSPSTEKILEVKNVSQKGIVYDINFTLHKNEILGVFGLMGSGRTELARIIFGLDPYESGEIIINGIPMKKGNPIERIAHRMAFVTENRHDEGLLMDVSIVENISLVSLDDFCRTKFRIINKSELFDSADNIKDSLKIKSGPIEKSPAKSLSGGNQQKVVIGKWLMSNPSVFILDEPTRGIDVGAKYEVYKIIDDLSAQGTGVLFISSEIEELIGMCDRILVMSNGEIQGSFERSEFDQEKIMRVAFRQSED